MSGPSDLQDSEYNYYGVDVLLGSTPQPVTLVVDLLSTLFAVFSYSCILCPGEQSFDTSLSTTFQVCWLSLSRFRFLLSPSCFLGDDIGLGLAWTVSKQVDSRMQKTLVPSLTQIRNFCKFLWQNFSLCGHSMLLIPCSGVCLCAAWLQDTEYFASNSFIHSNTIFDWSLRFVSQDNGTQWRNTSPPLSGHIVEDTVSFGGVLENKNQDFG